MVHTQTEQLRQKLEQLLLPPSNLAGHGMLWHRNHEFRLIHAHHFSRVGIDPLVPSQRLPIGPHVLNTCRTCAEHVPSNARWKIPNSKKRLPPIPSSNHHPTTIQPPQQIQLSQPLRRISSPSIISEWWGDSVIPGIAVAIGIPVDSMPLAISDISVAGGRMTSKRGGGISGRETSPEFTRRHSKMVPKYSWKSSKSPIHRISMDPPLRELSTGGDKLGRKTQWMKTKM